MVKGYKKLKVKMVGSGTDEDPYTIDLPTWQGVEFDTDKGVKPPAAKAVVLVPEDECDDKGKINREKIKVKYKGSKWENHEPDIGDEEIIG